MLEHYWPVTYWSGKQLMRWIQWAIAQDRLVVVREDRDMPIVGLTIFRPMKLARANQTEVHALDFDQDGEVIYIDVAISTKGKQVLQSLLFAILARLGHRPLIAFKQLKYQDRLRVYPIGTFRRAVYGK